MDNPSEKPATMPTPQTTGDSLSRLIEREYYTAAELKSALLTHLYEQIVDLDACLSRGGDYTGVGALASQRSTYWNLANRIAHIVTKP